MDEDDEGTGPRGGWTRRRPRCGHYRSLIAQTPKPSDSPAEGASIASSPFGAAARRCVAAGAALLCLVAAACASGGKSEPGRTSSATGATRTSTSASRPKSHLPPGGIRKIARSTRGRAILAVVYDVLGHVGPKTAGGARPAAGHRFVAVRLAIENIGKGYYQRNPVSTAFARDDKGRSYRPPRTIHVRGGMHKLHLAPGESRGGLVLFQIPKTTRLRVFRFKPFATGREAVYRLK